MYTDDVKSRGAVGKEWWSWTEEVSGWMKHPLYHGIMVVGDGRGCVHCFKLSPNLRGCNNAGVATEARQGLRTVVTRRKKSAGKTESKDKNLDDTSAVASQMEPLLQVLGKARLRREVVTTLST